MTAMLAAGVDPETVPNNVRTDWRGHLTEFQLDSKMSGGLSIVKFRVNKNSASKQAPKEM
jgi:hypothetical protein